MQQCGHLSLFRQTMKGSDDMKKRAQTQRLDTHCEANCLDLAGEALLAGMTREQVIAHLVSRIQRDQGYLAYRRATGRRTSYDDHVHRDLRALALAACWLEES